MTTEKKPYDNTIINESIQKVAKGAVVIVIGTVIGLLLGFIGRVLVARFFTQTEYGIFSIGFTLLSIFAAIGTLGLQGGVTRLIAYYISKEKPKKAGSVVTWSLRFGIGAGLTFFLILFLASDLISYKVFSMPNISIFLKILSVAIPFLILTNILTSIFRGVGRVKERVFFINFLKNGLFLLFLIPVILFSLSFKWCILTYSASIIVTALAFLIYFVKKNPVSFRLYRNSKNSVFIGKELLFFSVPLLFVSFLGEVLNWTDTLMLGYLNTPEIVGLYNAARPLCAFVGVPFSAMIFVYIPIASGLYAKSKKNEMKRNYAVLTKWVCSAMLPIAMVLALFPGTILGFLFGSEYILAETALRILVLGFFIDYLMGPNWAALTAMGHTKFLMWATFVAAFINIVLNAFLIPRFGITGAAIATVTAVIMLGIIRSIKLYSISQIHSFEKNLLKPIFLSTILFLAIYLIIKKIVDLNPWTIACLFILFIFLYIISLLITKSFDQEDISMLLKLEQKLGLNLSFVKRILQRFL